MLMVFFFALSRKSIFFFFDVSFVVGPCLWVLIHPPDWKLQPLDFMEMYTFPTG